MERLLKFFNLFNRKEAESAIKQAQKFNLKPKSMLIDNDGEEICIPLRK